MTENQSEIIEQLSVPRYAPRLKPTTIPTARWNEEPLLCLQVNDEWVSHLLGVIVALDQGDTWLGTAEQIYDARQQVNEIMLAFMEQCDPMSNCCPEPNRTRYTSDGRYEVSYDGGTTWEDGSDFDPRYTSPTFPPIPGDDGSAKKCDAANSVLVQIKDKVEAWQGYLSTAGTLVEFTTAVVTILVAGIFAPAAIPFIFPICIAIIKTCWDAGEEAYGLAFTDTVFNDLLCILFCHTQADGTYTDADIGAIVGDCASQFDPIPRDAFTAAFRGWGAVGTTNAAAIGGGGEECDDCDCADDLRVFSWDEVSEGAVELFPDEDGVYTAHSGTVTSGPYYVAWILFQPRTEWEPTTWNCHNITEISNGTGHGPFKYRCSDFAADSLATCAAAYTYYSNAGTFDVTFTVGDLCGEH